jgi:ribonuclease VapC
MNKVVLDASALLAFLNQEPGSSVLESLLPQSVMSTVNWAEVVAKLQERGVWTEQSQFDLEELGITIIAFDLKQALITGALRSLTKSAGLSLGDRACLALGIQLNLPVLTTDRIWAQLDLPIQVQVLR